MKIRPSINLLSWISTGELAGISPGDQKHRVLDIFGQPDGWASTSTDEDIKDFMIADMWGYGVWTFYFENDVLDGVTCCVSGLGEATWSFALGNTDAAFLESMQEAEKILADHKIPCYRLPKIYKVKNIETGEILERKRRLAAPTILAGTGFKTRITFDDNGKVKVIGAPFNFTRQVVGYATMDAEGTHTLVTEFEVPRD